MIGIFTKRGNLDTDTFGGKMLRRHRGNTAIDKLRKEVWDRSLTLIALERN